MRIIFASILALSLASPTMANDHEKHQKDANHQKTMKHHSKHGMFEMADANRDGMISRAEFDSAHDKKKEMWKDRREERSKDHDGQGIAVSKLDRDANGFITRKEMKDAHQDQRKMNKGMDRDGYHDAHEYPGNHD